MGYTTYFEGQFELDKPLTPAQHKYLTLFAETRRMVRSNEMVNDLVIDINESNELSTVGDIPADKLHEHLGLGLGENGEYFVGGAGMCGQDHDSSILDYNNPPSNQPGLWNQWIPNEDGTSIEWDGGEKFYGYVEWLEYIITHFLKPWGYTVNGAVKWSGEDSDDMGAIVVNDNVVNSRQATITY